MKVYGIFNTFWIEDFYEEENLYHEKLFSSHDKAYRYLTDNIDKNDFLAIYNDEVDGMYFVIYDKYLHNQVKECGIKKVLWGREGVYWCQIRELEVE